jgi:NAD(P)-dependent dehydrogenase (short-subunit alcohol dehydrogenase family)
VLDRKGRDKADKAGAASGIGKSAVFRFAAAGARAIYAVDLSPINEGEYNQLVADQGHQTQIVALSADITSSNSIENLVRTVLKDHYRLDWFASFRAETADSAYISLRMLALWTSKISPPLPMNTWYGYLMPSSH